MGGSFGQNRVAWGERCALASEANGCANGWRGEYLPIRCAPWPKDAVIARRI
jgi:hypothetical protein